MDTVRLVPPAVDHKVGDALATDGVQDLDDVLVRGHAPDRAVFIEEDGQVLLRGGTRVRRAHARFHELLAAIV